MTITATIIFIIKHIFLLCSFALLSSLKMSSILGCFHACFTGLTIAQPVILSSSVVGFLYIIWHMKLHGIVYKLPGLTHGILYLLAQRYLLLIRWFIITLLLFLVIIFVCFFDNTIVYALPWLGCIGYMLITRDRIYNVLEIHSILTWVAHAVGTVIYGYCNGFLSPELYMLLLPQVIIERCTGVAIMIFVYYYIIYVNKGFESLLARLNAYLYISSDVRE